MKKTYILGQGGFAYELYEQIFLDNFFYDFGGFIVLKDNKAFVFNDKEGSREFDYNTDSQFILGTGTKKWRTTFLTHFLEKYPATLEHFPNVCSKQSYISRISKMGIGNVFCAFSLVNANAQLGNFNMFNVYASIHHDCILGSYNILSPHATVLGNCKVGDLNFFGSHATLVPKAAIGNDNTISSLECVFDNLGDREFFQSGVIYKKP